MVKQLNMWNNTIR